MRGWAVAIVASLLAGAGAAEAQRPIAELQAAARAGDAGAQFQLGEAYRTGTGVAIDRDQALTWLKRAADQGSEPARDALGMLLFTRGNRQEAMPLIEAAAARGDARALYILATARFNGDYLARDWPRAYAEMSRAAELGLPQARASLAQMEPYLLPADRAKADEIRATMAAVTAPAAAPPRNVSVPEPRRVAAASAPVAVPSGGEAMLGLPAVPARGASGPGFSLAPSASAATRTPTRFVPPPPMPAPSAPPPLAPAASAPPPGAATPRPAPAPSVIAAAPAPRAERARAVAPAVAPPGRWRVQLGAYGSTERAETQWKTLAAKYPALARHAHVVTPAGTVFRLQAQGIAGRDEAASLCRDIVAGGGGCFQVAP